MSSFALPKPIVKICSNVPNQEIGNRTAGPSDTAAVLVVDGGSRYQNGMHTLLAGPLIPTKLLRRSSLASLRSTGLALASAPWLARGWGLLPLVACLNVAAPRFQRAKKNSAGKSDDPRSRRNLGRLFPWACRRHRAVAPPRLLAPPVLLSPVVLSPRMLNRTVRLIPQLRTAARPAIRHHPTPCRSLDLSGGVECKPDR